MDYSQLIRNLSPQTYRSLQRAIETGRWPNGESVSAEQRSAALQAVIAWGEEHLPEEQRVGYIDRGSKAGEQCEDSPEQPIRWLQQE